MQSIRPHFDHRKEVPILGLQQIACEFEAFSSHFEELLLQFCASVCSEIWDVNHIIAGDLIDFPRQSSRKRPL